MGAITVLDKIRFEGEVMSENLVHKVTMVVGDWSDDGHGKTQEFNFKTNRSIEELGELYEKGVEITGHDIMSHCEDYEDRTVPCDLMQKFTELFPQEMEDFSEVETDCTLQIWPEDFAHLVCLTIKAADPDVVFEPVQSENWCIGGYGLFS